MGNIHHKPIRHFFLDGQIHDDAAIGRLKTEYIRLVTAEMRLSGYVPRLDIDPDFTIEFNSITEYFTFRLSMYGTYVGRRKSEWITGIDGTTTYTQQNKSSEYSQGQASTSNQK
jgi:hypothetical protein